MIQIVSSMELHDREYPIYVFIGKELKETIMTKPCDTSTEILNQYMINKADKIVLAGNDLLTCFCKKEIEKINSVNYRFNNLVIERMQK